MSDTDKSYKAFEKKQAKAEKVGARRRIEDAPPPGMSTDGKLNVVAKDAPAWKPKVVDDEGNEVEMD